MRHVHGITTTEWLEAQGLTRKRLRRMPEWERVGRGLYRMPGAREDFWYHAAHAILGARPGARLTGASALHAAGIMADAPEVIDVVVHEQRGSRKPGPYRVRRSCHLPEDAIRAGGLPLVPIDYALTDLARDVPDALVAMTLSRAFAARRARLDSVRQIADVRGKFPGSSRLRRVLEDFADGESHSKRERMLRQALRDLGARHMHPTPLDILGPDGQVIGQADIPILDVQLDVEVDGPHHFDPVQQLKDRNRDHRMRTIVRWEVVRHTIFAIDEDVVGVARSVMGEIERLREMRRAADAA